MSSSTEIAATVWAPSYKRATVMQASLAAISTIAAVLAWVLGGGLSWLVGAVVIFSVVPFTLLGIKPTNTQLLAPGRDLSCPETRRLLERWGKLHAVRSLLSAIASIIFFAALIWNQNGS
ncbi:MAG TPA: DUF1772 domain-containing protein [Pyrinomonadaceae bacterium]|nr:DUF1772 domain-containing protein [Pyrinomonadaceae bacterium]